MGEERETTGYVCRGPIVGAKCTYQNPELSHIRVDVAKVGFKISHVKLRVSFVKRTRCVA